MDEAVDVWRPVPAMRLATGTYELIAPDDFDPEVEMWEFSPGSVVEVETRELSEGPTVVAVRLAEHSPRTGRVDS